MGEGQEGKRMGSEVIACPALMINLLEPPRASHGLEQLLWSQLNLKLALQALQYGRSATSGSKPQVSSKRTGKV